jgi:tetratricopeptide (TPR) repeat protein
MLAAAARAAGGAAAGGEQEPLPDVAVDKLDYAYVDSCENAGELKDILRVLQSGKEGRWYDLEKHVEARLVSVLPAKERRLWLAQHTEPSRGDVEAAASELEGVLLGLRTADAALRGSKSNGAASAAPALVEDSEESRDEGAAIFDAPVRASPATVARAAAAAAMATASSSSNSSNNNNNNNHAEHRRLPPVRGLGAATAAPPRISQLSPAEVAAEAAKREKERTERLSGYDFRAWDKFDVDAEMERLDKAEAAAAAERERAAAARQAEIEARRAATDESRARTAAASAAAEGLSDAQRLFFSEREKEKGNESFRAGEYEDALRFYTRAIELLPVPSRDARPWANRAMAHIKLEHWQAAEQDCDRALELDSAFSKAYARRGVARHRRGKYAAAIEDFEEALLREAGNSKLLELLAESRRKFNEVGGIGAEGPGKKAETFKKLMIIEDEEEEEEEAAAAAAAAAEEEQQQGPQLEESKDGSEQGHDDEVPLVEEVERTPAEPLAPPPAQPEVVVSWVDAKRAGTELFRAGNFAGAVVHFSKAVAALHEAQEPEARENLVNCLGNVAVCRKELSQWSAVVEACDRVLSLSPDNVKALFRRGAALEALARFEPALNDFCQVLRLDPNMKEAGDRISVLMGYLNNTATAPPAQTDVQCAAPVLAPAPAPAPAPTPTHAAAATGGLAALAERLKEEGNELFKRGLVLEAEAKYSESLAMQTSVSTLANRAMARLKLGRATECECDCTEGLRLLASQQQQGQPGEPEARQLRVKLLYRRAGALQLRGQDEAAADDLEAVLAAEPQNARAADELAALRAAKVALGAAKAKAAAEAEAMAAAEAEAKAAQEARERKERAANEEAAARAAKEALRQKERRDSMEEQQNLAERAKAKAQVLRGGATAAPKTGYEFEQTWRALAGPAARLAYLRGVDLALLPKLFKVELPEETLLDIVAVLNAGLLAAAGDAADAMTLADLQAFAANVLRGLAALPRFSTTVRFLSAQDKLKLNALLDAVADAQLKLQYQL